MAYSGEGHVDILSRASGKSLAQLSAGNSHSFFLTQPSVISLQGTPSLVASYQQQGQDLILHMRDGSTVRYQHFFTVMDGEQSELVFQEGGQSLQQALFASELQTDPQAIVALTPGYEPLENVDALIASASTPAAEASNPVTAVGLGVLGLIGAGAGVAAASGGSGGGNDASGQTAANSTASADAAVSSETAATATVSDAVASDATVATAAELTTPDTADAGATATAAAPSLTVNSFTGDGVVSADEKLSAQTLSGTTQNLAAGSPLTISLNGKTYTTELAQDGSWNVAIPAADLQLLPPGSNQISISFANEAGGTTTASKTITVEASEAPADAPLPNATIDTPFGDGLMNENEHYAEYTLTGTTGVAGTSQQVTLTIDGVSYAGTVDSEGNWRVPLSLDAMREAAFSEGGHDISVIVTDPWGRTATTTSSFTVDTLHPPVTINTLSNDNLIDASEINQPLVISGTGEAGSALTVTFNGESYTPAVGEDGTWQFTVPASTLQNLSEGSYVVAASVSDEAGNASYSSQTLQVYASEALPGLTFNTISGDDAVSYREGIYGVEITGTSTHLASGTQIVLTLDGKTWTGGVYNNGWTVQLSDTDLAAITDGNYSVTVSATDVNGNSTSATHDLLLITHYGSSNPVVTPNEVTLADAVERDGQTWYTLTGTLSGSLPIQMFAVQSSEMSWRDGAIGENGQWSVEVNSYDLGSGIGSNTLLFGVQDGAGNWFEQVISVSYDLETPVESGSNAGTTTPAEDNPTDGDSASADNPTGGDTTPVDNSADTPAATTGSPSLAVNSFTGDGVVSAGEKLSAQTLSGITHNLAAGSTLTISLNGKTYTTALAQDGSWNVEIPAADLQLLPVGSNRISISFANGVGGTTTASKTISVEASEAPADAPLPHATIDAPFGDGWLNSDEHYQAYTLTGSTGVTGVSQQIALTIDGVSYSGTVDGDGIWSVPLSLNAMMNSNYEDGEHTVAVTVTDAWGRTDTATTTFIADARAPSVFLNNVSGDNLIDAGEINEPLVISGTGDAGAALTVTFNGESWNSTIGEGGQWQFTVPASTIQTLAEGSYVVEARVSDEAGNSYSTGKSVQVYAADTLPELTINPISGDDAVNYREGIYGVEITGTSAHLPTGTTIELTIDGKTWTGGVYGNNSWSVQLSDTDLASLTDGTYTVAVRATDANGNSTSTSRDLLLITHYNSSNPVVTVNDVTQADAVYHDGQLWYKVSGTAEGTFPVSLFSIHGSDKGWFDGVINEDGSWSVDVRAYELGSVEFGIQDRAGNWFEQTIYVNTPDAPSLSVVADSAVAVLVADNPVDSTATTLSTAATIATAADSITAEATATAAATATPKPTITTPFVDYWLNVQERSHDETLSGTTGITGSGQSVVVKIGSTTYQATVTEGGSWTLLLTPAQMAASNFADGRHWAHVTVTNAEGETGTTCATFVTDSVMPHVTLSELADGNRINASDITDPLVLSGTGDAGNIVTLTLGAATWQITVAANGTWQASMSAAEVQAMAPGDYTLSATIASRSGNASSTSLDVSVYTTDALPTLTIDIVGTDDAINISEGVYGMAVTGTSTHLASGSRVELTLDGQTYSGYVNGNSWSVQIDDNALKAVADGYYTFTVAATDADGNSTSASRDVWLLTHPRTSNPTVTANEITAADAIYHDSVLYYTVSGTMAAIFPLTLVALKSDIMQTYYTATVSEDGSWTVDIPANELQNGFNTLTFGVLDIAENWEEQQVGFVTTLSTASLTTPDGTETAATATLAEDNPTDGETVSGTDNGLATATATATESNDSVTDSSLAENSLNGESISGSANIIGTASDDTFRLSSLDFSHLDGGAGHDTLILSGSHLTLDFAALGLKIASIETLDLGTTGTNSLTLGKTDLLQLTDNGSETLTIKGVEGNTVNLSTTEGGVWSDVGHRTVDGQQYDIYHNSSASYQGMLADVLIQHNLQVQTA
ncbi:Ig-like domain-containing protein [Pantoea sp. MBD-2R]|uniref:Ig-like domain-containing protein n=1 Tax=Pantoea sp. MBD-2R TaxID=3141540 RepID=UPI00318309EA